jgi:hypothetical protein
LAIAEFQISAPSLCDRAIVEGFDVADGNATGAGGVQDLAHRAAAFSLRKVPRRAFALLRMTSLMVDCRFQIATVSACCFSI